MRRQHSVFLFTALAAAPGCGGEGPAATEASATGASGSSGSTGEPGATGGSTGAASTTADGPTEGSAGTTGGAATSCDEVPGLIAAYKAAHGGNGGKDWDLNARDDAELASDPLAQQLLALCGPEQRPVIPALAWEYGGDDHPWIAPEASALFYCVYIPVNPSSEHWRFDAGSQKVTADMTIGCPAQNPCSDQDGAQKVLACLGDMSNIEILVDTMSRDDGVDVGYDLSEASTDMWLLLDDDARVFVYTDP